MRAAGMGARALVLAVAALGAAAWGAGGGGGSGCGVAEFACRSGQCVRLDRFCDGIAQCMDGSDEPPHCSPCNRTYYGRAGVAYALAVGAGAGVGDAPPPPPPRVPFLCHLTFTAGGGTHGDLVQLAFEEFRVGRYTPGNVDGCPDGYMQLAELGRPFTGGSWCGASEGAALYYSETATVTVSVKLFRARLGEPFGLKLRYKFLQQRDAVVRFGALEAPLERGAVSPGTYCTRTYEECHRKPCRLQSPNYPGMYPRNVTCYWSLRQKDIPTCKHAMISVRQDHSHKMQIKRSISMASLNKTGRAVRAWRECTGERDRLIFYDGASTDDPVLVEYCGGDWLPRVTARGPEMLVAFHSSPYSAPLRPPAPLAPLRGFELDVDVIFADSDSLDYAREARRCEFHVKASSTEEEGNGTTPGAAGRGRRGRLHAPTHTLPPNTTCTWTFHGRPGDLVWIYFSSFTQYSLVDGRRTESSEREEEGAMAPPRPPTSTAAKPIGAPCGVELRVWDGGGGGVSGEGVVLGRYCDEVPRLCARAALANATRSPRPCSPPDGYVSTMPLLSLAATSRSGTATHPLRFALHYEFIDARLAGAALPSNIPRVARPVPAACARLLTRPGELLSPGNALWFGRGGARRLRCVYRLQSESHVAIELATVSFGRRPRCFTRSDPASGRMRCVPEAMEPEETPVDEKEANEDFDGEDDAPMRVPHLMIYEAPWPGYRVPLGCICDNTSAPIRHSGAGALELVLTARSLVADEDARHLHFRGSWSTPAAPAYNCAARRRLPPPGGHIHLLFPYELMKAICPSSSDEGRAVQIFTDEWWGRGRGGGSGSALLVVWAAREAGSARMAWMEVWRPAGTGPIGTPGAEPVNATAMCVRGCSALAACMPSALWCDGAQDCPGGADEAAGAGCGAAARLLAALGAPAAAGALAALGGAAALGVLLLAALRRRRRADKALLAAGGRRATEELLFDSRASSVAS
ncbi:uncharacterized protein LOC134745601 isoform X2 [Cydia strobilella]|uniref:uncharacterized protein LOC134745601 isoform X2 n=1 Tax=Cydia strobilella TaxID=1100964 RepID=UPI003004A62E